jgi:hypothetical protein
MSRQGRPIHPKLKTGRPRTYNKDEYSGPWVKVRIPLKREDVMRQAGAAHEEDRPMELTRT